MKRSFEELCQLGTDFLQMVVAIDSQSDEHSTSIPSTEGQRRLSEALARFFEETTGLLHAGEGRRDQHREPHEVWPDLAHLIHQHGRLHVDAQVVNLEGVCAEQRGEDVLAEVMDVATHGGEDHRAGGSIMRGGWQVRFDLCNRCLEDLGGQQQLGQIVVAILEALADPRHALATLGQDRERVLARFELASNHLGDVVVRQLQDGHAQLPQ